MKDNTKLVIGLGFAVVLGLMSTLVYVSLAQLRAIDQDTARMVQQTNAKTGAANIMRDAIRLRTHSLYVMLSTDDPFELDEQSILYHDYAGTYIGARERLLQAQLNEGERALLRQLDQATRKAQPENDKALSLVVEGAQGSRVLDQIRIAQRAQQEVLNLLDRLVSLESAHTGHALTLNREHYIYTRNQLLALSAATVVICLFIALIVVRKAAARNRHISHQASHDSLTGLINRRQFEDDLRALVARTARERSVHALFYMDLDQFKIVNDTCGHAAGDELLRQISTELRQHIRKADVLARLGGDEFGVLLCDCDAVEASRVAETLTRVVRNFRFLWGENSFVVGASIGVVSISAATPDVEELLSMADAACYAAKDQGRNRIYVYQENDAELSRRHSEMQLTGRISRALEEDRFVLFCQEIMPTSGTCARRHHEVLVRMRDANQGLLPPGGFIPAAERYGLIVELDRWVLKNTVRWLSTQALDPATLTLAVNISGSSLSDRSFLDYVVDQLHTYSAPARSLCFEITETCAIANYTAAERFMKVLKEMGCQFALDDFGTGLSSFHYLKNLPVDYLKIDGGFIRDLTRHQVDVAMVRAINDIAHVLNTRTIAEFVESEAILSLVRELGIDYAQGFAIGRPAPLEDLAAQASAVA